MSTINSQYIAITDNYTNGNKSDAKDMIASLTGNQITDFISYCVKEIEDCLTNYPKTQSMTAYRMCMKYALTEIESRLTNFEEISRDMIRDIE